MPLLCPNCRATLDATALACPNGHRFMCEDGVLSLLAEDFGRQLQAFLSRFTAARAAEGKRLLDPAAYEQLPFGQDRSHDAGWRTEWRLRRYDLALIQQLLRERPAQAVLDIGAWNGWLSHRLAGHGHQVTAVDYFADDCDGLRARKFYRSQWRAIQMDLRDLSVLDEQFDVVILNRCLQFFPDPPAYVQAARRRVRPGGLLLLTGLSIFDVPGPKAARVAAQQREHRARYETDLFLFPNKGFLDGADQQQLKSLGLVLRRYPQLWAANLKAWLNPALPRHYYGLWHA